MNGTDSNQLDKQYLDKLLAEREDIDLMISILRKRIGVSGEAEIESAPSIETPESLPIAQGEFFGLSRAEAAIRLLEKARRPLPTNELFQRLKDSGLENMKAKNALTALYTSLSRHQEVCKVARNTWGLKKWYPHLKEKKKASDSASETENEHD